MHSAPPPLIPESAIRAREKKLRNGRAGTDTHSPREWATTDPGAPVPVRSAPPPPDSATAIFASNGAVSSGNSHRFTTDIPQPEDLFIAPHTHPGTGKEQRTLTLGSRLESADHAIAQPVIPGLADITAVIDASKLKRSPAMMLSSEQTAEDSAATITQAGSS